MKVSRKILKRVIIILITIWVFLLIALYLTSGKFEDHAIQLFHKQAARYLKTQILIRDPGDINLTFFRNFPDASLTIKNVYLLSVDEYDRSEFSDFEDLDTLMYAGRVSLVLDLWSLLTNKYELKKIIIEDGRMNILTDSRGEINYDVFKDDTEEDDDEDVTYNTEKIILRNMRVNYIDRDMDLIYTGTIEEAEASGRFIGFNFKLAVEGTTTDNFVQYIGYDFEHPATVFTDVYIDKEEKKYTLTDGRIHAYGVPVNFSGVYNFGARSYDWDFDLYGVSVRNVDRKLLDKYIADLELTPTGGNLSLHADVSADSNTHDKYDVRFELKQGAVLNRSYNISLHDIYMKGSFTNGRYRNNSSSILNIEELRCISGRSRLSYAGTISNFDLPQIRGNIEGTLDMAQLLLVESLAEQFVLRGSANGKLNINGRLPRSKNIGLEDLSSIKLEGMVNLDQVYIEKRDKSIPEVTLSGQLSLKSLQEISLENLAIKTGQSDLLVNGKVCNLPQFSNDKSLVPVFNGSIRSGAFHVKDFMVESSSAPNEPLRLTLPDSVIVSGDLVIDQFYFNQFHASQVTSMIHYVPKKLTLTGFDMNTQGGRIESDHIIEQKNDLIYTYSTARFDKIDIGDLFYSVNDFNLDVITHNNIDGILTGGAEIRAAWDRELNPVYDDISGQTEITIENGELKDYQPMMALSSFIEMEELKHIKFEKMNMDIRIRDKNLHIAQTDIKSSVFAVSGSGDHRFDNSYTYKVQIRLDEVLWKKLVNRKPQNYEFGQVVDDGLGKTTIPLVISGKDTLYTVAYDRKKAGSNIRDKLNKEKEVWQNIGNRDPDDEYKDEIYIDWNDETEGQEKKNKRIEKYEEQDEEFIIEFDPDQ